MLDLELGFDLSDSTAYADTIQLYNNTRGFRIAGQIGERVSFQSALFENQGFYPLYYKTRADSFLVIPGQGRWKDFENGGFDFSASTGKVAVDLGKGLQASVGHGKYFIGNGYRSMILSDFSFNAPYAELRWQSKNNKWLIVKSLMGLSTLDRLPLGEVPESLFKRKSLSFHYVNYIPVKGVEIGLFESTVWKRFSEDGTEPMPWNAIASIPLSNTVINGFENNDHLTTVGLNVHLHFSEQLRLYGQVVTSNPSADEYAYQIGLISGQLPGGFRIRGEYNFAIANTYQHPSTQDFTHNNDPLAHPLGNGFQEAIGIVDHRIKRWWSMWKVNYQNFYALSTQLERPEMQEKTERFILEAQLGYTMNPRMRWQWLIGARYFTDHPGPGNTPTTWIYGGMRIAIVNKYYDF
ncbi:MAG: hypothetical protein HRT74_01075 [Flavobacteriales bacterium]|nr:hypothetical protein [Flavobacteriales bacterium]